MKFHLDDIVMALDTDLIVAREGLQDGTLNTQPAASTQGEAVHGFVRFLPKGIQPVTHAFS